MKGVSALKQLNRKFPQIKNLRPACEVTLRRSSAHGIGVPDDLVEFVGILVGAPLLEIAPVQHSRGNVLDEPWVLENVIYVDPLLHVCHKNAPQQVFDLVGGIHASGKGVLTSAHWYFSLSSTCQS